MNNRKVLISRDFSENCKPENLKKTGAESFDLFEILEHSQFSHWEKEEVENLLDSLKNSNHRLRRSINPDLLKKLLLIQAFSRPTYHRTVIKRVPVQKLEQDENEQLIDETSTPDSRKTRQSAQVFDNTLFMVLETMTIDGKYSQDKLRKTNF